VIDEAHNYRNPYTPTRAAVLRNLLWGARPKDLVMLTATPVNNSLWDFFNLLRFFVRQNSQFADRGIPDLQGAFTQAMARDAHSSRSTIRVSLCGISSKRKKFRYASPIRWR